MTDSDALRKLKLVALKEVTDELIKDSPVSMQLYKELFDEEISKAEGQDD